MPKIDFVDGEKKIINGKEYEYCAFYKRLVETNSSNSSLLCPACLGSHFTLNYGEWCVAATCVRCGHEFTAYDG